MTSAAPPARTRGSSLGRAGLALIAALGLAGPARGAGDEAVDADDPRFAGRFVGRVVDVADRPVANARVYAVPAVGAEGPGAVRAVTGPDGRFAFDAPDLTFTARDGLPARRPGLLIAHADGFAPDAVSTWGRVEDVNHNNGGMPAPGDEIVARLPRDDVPVRGRLVDPDGRPLAGARVRVTHIIAPAGHDLIPYLEGLVANRGVARDRYIAPVAPLPGVDRLATADADGRFRLGGIGRDRVAGFAVGGPISSQRQLQVAAADVPEIVLARDADGLITRGIMPADFSIRMKPGDAATATIRGVVRDRATHQPAPGMAITTNFNPGGPEGSRPPVSDAEGRFEVAEVDPKLLEPVEPPGPGPAPANWQRWQVGVYADATPGALYLPSMAFADRREGVIIECARGVPFRIRVVDEAGMPVDVEATVGSCALAPNNPVAAGLIPTNVGINFPLGPAARRGPGVYEGFAAPGVGAVLVDVPDEAGYRAAQVDPKAFFAPGQADGADLNRIRSYGTRDTLALFNGGTIPQAKYEAIVLINPPADSPPLELTATLRHDRPIAIELVDFEGKPVVGAQAVGLGQGPSGPNAFESALPLRSATFPLRRLAPGGSRRLYFHHDERKLVGSLLARADMAGPARVVMRPWASLKGHLVDEEGRPIGAATPEFGPPWLTTLPRPGGDAPDDPAAGWLPTWWVNHQDGTFQLDRLVPGQRYAIRIFRNQNQANAASKVVDVGLAFDGTLDPGEGRDLGAIQARTPAPAPAPAPAPGR